MFVPFVFLMEPIADYGFLIPFYNYVDMVKDKGWPIIAHERYYQSLEKMRKLGVDDALLQKSGKLWKFTPPTQQTLDDLHKFMIPQDFETDLIAQFPSQQDAWIHLLTTNHPVFESIISDILDEIEAQYNNDVIEGILCYCLPLSLRAVADKRGIPILCQHGGAIRPPFYKDFIGYMDKVDFFAKGELEERFLRFREESQQSPLLSRKGLFKLFVSEQHLGDIHFIDNEPIFDVGVLLTAPFSSVGLVLQHSHISNEEICLRVRRKYPAESVLIRAHPNFTLHQDANDESPTSFHFSCKCTTVVTIIGSGVFEVMWIGRKMRTYVDNPFCFMEAGDLGGHDADIAPLDFINFVIFAYMHPMEWMTDPKHLRFLLSEPSEVDVYMKAFKHHTSHLSEDDIELFYKTEGREYRLGMPLFFTSGIIAHQSAFLYSTQGLSVCEGAFTWSDGDSSCFEFDLTEVIGGDLMVDARLSMVIVNENGEQVVTCLVNDVQVGSVTLSEQSRSLAYKIPGHLAKNKKLSIAFNYSDATFLGGGDRKLAVAFEQLRISHFDNTPIDII